ncbi:DUF6226 family protein [Leucobacter sp. UT-8R-CII-1-4]|uniref:DUF6226 family protein n=1 Tax=Leucobacter sp. UT-8R-CII-1-4 TaxID=3040075 RepID=UPI0024A8C4F4|nr:DUF6226 family protein [Leucobacter sp. UT-8R-CII-1-4]MDI6023171.1 DUF6226 family protein [Leucobacter sp. UT-8R-CII-1-4]
MSTYVRPSSGPVVFRDAAGKLINYGSRWQNGPPEDSYSTLENLERFRPLHRVAEALIEHLLANYEVTVESGSQLTEGLEHAPAANKITRAVRLTPHRNGSSPLLFVFTNYPGVWLYAGTFFSGAYPVCGCNACDEIWQTQADSLEQDTFAIISGGLTESVNGPVPPEVTEDRNGQITIGMSLSLATRIISADGSFEGGSESNAENVPFTTLSRYRATLDRLALVSNGGNWLPWPRAVQPR